MPVASVYIVLCFCFPSTHKLVTYNEMNILVLGTVKGIQWILVTAMSVNVLNIVGGMQGTS
jgi:hypothetical protein